MTAGTDRLKHCLRHVLWVGGGSGAGKSTVAKRLADLSGAAFVSTDDTMTTHAARCSPEDTPYLTQFLAMSMDERWLNRSPEVMLDTFHWYRGEAFEHIVDDLLGLPGDRPVIVEGFRLLPLVVAPLLTAPHQALWLCPTPEFRRQAFTARGTLMDIAGKTSNPPRALANLLQRDALFTNRVAEEAKRLGLTVTEVASPMTADDLTGRVAKHFGL